jgi:hypothetical protein
MAARNHRRESRKKDSSFSEEKEAKRLRSLAHRQTDIISANE